MGVFSSLRNLFSKKEINQKRSSSSKKNNNAEEKATTNSLSSKKGSVSNHSNAINSSTNSVIVTSPSGSTRQTSSNGYSFQYRDGRRYHAGTEVAYVFPNDDDEVDRVHQQHWILRYALQCNYHAPITKQLEEGITVLDSGCGPATWAFEMGETYPCSKFHGIDASCVFPEDIKPANVEFVIGNIAKDVPYDENFFDFIHQRLLILGLTDDDWTNALKELYRVLKPGGYIELAEPDLQDLFLAGPAMHLLQSTLSEMSKVRGLTPKIACQLEERLLIAGFTDVVVKITDIPLNHSGKIGELLWCDYRHAYMNIRPVMAKAHPEWEDPVVYEAHIDQCAAEAKKNKSVLKWYSVYARKPQPPEVEQEEQQKSTATEEQQQQ